MLPENFQPTRNKNRFKFLLNSVWKTNSGLPFPHHTAHFCSDGSGVFETTSDISLLQVGDKFFVDTHQFEIDVIESGPFQFDDNLKLTSVYFFSPKNYK